MEWVRHWTNDRGKHWLDGWRVDRRHGDCNDFALTVAWDGAGRNILIFLIDLIFLRSVFWLVWSEHNGLIPRHVVLYRRGKGWIDSNNTDWRKSHKQRRLAIPLSLPPFLIWAVFRILWGWAYGRVTGR